VKELETQIAEYALHKKWQDIFGKGFEILHLLWKLRSNDLQKSFKRRFYSFVAILNVKNLNVYTLKQN
jgi:hypothetical protein